MTAAFNLSQLANNLNTAGQLDATDGLVGALPVGNGGTARTTLTANNLLAGNGTGQVNLIAPGPSGDVLVSNGTAWISSSAPAQTTSQVLSAIAGSSGGAVGTYAWLGRVGAGSFALGDNFAASNFVFATNQMANSPLSQGDNADAIRSTAQNGTPTGTWKAMSAASTQYYAYGLFLRIS